MKQFTLLTLFVCSSIYSLQAQNDSERNHEIGVSTAFLSDALFNSNDASPYLITYKYISNEGAFRLGLGGSYIDNNDNDENSTVFRDIAYDMALRVGYERRFPIKTRWIASLGLDVGYQVTGAERETSDFFNGTNSRIKSAAVTTIYNFGVVGGLQFYINDRISISTETNIMANFISNATTIDFSNGFDDVEDTNSNTLIGINLPTSLYLVLRF